MAAESILFESRQNGGYDLEFIGEPPDGLKCLICLFSSRDPLQHGKCGKIFCNSCLAMHKTKNNRCPYCREENPQYFKDAKSKRDILALKVYCPYKQHGCSWQGETREVESHSNSCDCRVISCPRKCGKQILFTNLIFHLEEECTNRDYECQMCGEWGIYAEMTTSHVENCPNKPIPCPNEGCHDELTHQSISHHILKACDYTILECKYKSLGCTARFLRKDMANHEEDDKYHLRIAIAAISELRERSASVQLQMSSVHRQSLSRTDAKKLKSDIKQGIEKIHLKCENLQHEVQEFNGKFEDLHQQIENLRDKYDANVTTIDLVKEKMEALKEDLKKVNKQYLNIQQECNGIQSQVAKVRHKKLSHLQYRQDMEDRVGQRLDHLQDHIIFLNQRINELSTDVGDMKSTFEGVMTILCFPCIKCGCFLGTLVTIIVIVTLWFFLF